jgi:hypothetical protein
MTTMHECPECGQACDCDSDDVWNDEAAVGCRHQCEQDDLQWLSPREADLLLRQRNKRVAKGLLAEMRIDWLERSRAITKEQVEVLRRDWSKRYGQLFPEDNEGTNDDAHA